VPSCGWEHEHGRYVLSTLSKGLEAGEVITISYLSREVLEHTTDERREDLAKGWLFLCQCARCGPVHFPACSSCGSPHSILFSEGDESPYGEYNVNCDGCGLVDVALECAYFGHCFHCEADLCPRCGHGKGADGV
jgi:hypothetical protein